MRPRDWTLLMLKTHKFRCRCAHKDCLPVKSNAANAVNRIWRMTQPTQIRHKRIQLPKDVVLLLFETPWVISEATQDLVNTARDL